ncbi:uncharacterized protein LOC121405135 [Drosophila obscura]|uniref:uncharacterized protein LOC121405135 n=1 Tax=Drosophila obscura TaxID=7282 RepID=UPI001BB11350|nr:uncharacterized protein LOC121405135 [Drosophila obscura]
MKRSPIGMAKFKQAQDVENPMGLIQEVATRWNSAFAMVKRLLDTNDTLSTVLLSLPKAPLPFSVEEIDIMKELAELLSPFQEATVAISGSKYVTISLVIPLTCEIQQKLNNLKSKLKTVEVLSALKFLCTRLNTRFLHYETRTVAQIATIIDPRFKKEGFLTITNADQAATALEKEIDNFLSKTPQELQTLSEPPPNPTFSFLQNKVKVKVKSTRADAIMTLRQHLENLNEPKETDPLLYWKWMNTGGMMPFKAAARKYFCIPATSCESERMFSKAGQIISERRSRLKPEVVDQLLFLNKNQDLF